MAASRGPAAVPHAEAARPRRTATSPCSKQYGVPYEVLDPRRLHRRRARPRHRARVPFVGGLRLPNDDTGDCKMFTEGLAELAAEPRRHVPLRHDDRCASPPRAAASPASPPTRACSRPTPMSWRWAAIRRCWCGRSASACRSIRSRAIRSPCRSPMTSCAPVSTVMDETYKVATTRLGNRIRVGGTAEIAGYDTTCAPRAAARSIARCATCSRRPAISPRRASGAGCGR